MAPSPRRKALRSLLDDIEAFVRTFASTINHAPLQAYAAALIFSPVSSQVRQIYWSQRVPFIKDSRGIENTPSPRDILFEPEANNAIFDDVV